MTGRAADRHTVQCCWSSPSPQAYIALESAPFVVSENSQFFRPITKGRTAFSAALLEISTSPCSTNAYRLALARSSHYQDYAGNEMDAIIELSDGV